MHEAPPRISPAPAATRAPTVCGMLSVLSLVLLTLVATAWRPLIGVDRDVAYTTHRWAHEYPALTQANRVLTDWVWDPWTMRALLAVTVVVLVRRGARRLAVLVAVTTAVGSLVQQGLKAAVDRARPVWPDPVDSAHYAAYPSGHAMTATVCFGLLLWLLRREGLQGAGWICALALAAVSVVGVGVTRVFLGVHWFSDVLAGWLLGAALVTGAVATFARGRRQDAAGG
ncbi:phosphatase PAP2 family protein [Streptomyces sp. GC420]|uniref:phosphatase PAP2 family protein n=1 Tax=Streptomyces sp. GC420 TaxID=2697568 RepID=UPI001414D03F|nr:phosphatase PAP2 family protein [Streptomyces sp. GC420]NBM14629.1 phosphatase PAP2 family protein [Streptomyces sp. GC420]